MPAIQRRKASFKNSEGVELAALLELPPGTPTACALFAHCFTCGKDTTAASRISRALAVRGIAVMRFDFTGLGGSDGDFGNTNFSSNVTDLLAAAEFLRDNYLPPSLLIGHSLGGTAVLAAAAAIPEARAVVTLGAPATPEHIAGQFKADLEKIRTQGEGEVELAGRSFTIKREFLDDIENQKLESAVAGLRKALLVMHAPFDAIVSIDEASKIFLAAKHPKSFVSLDSADHLLSKREDAEYAATTIAGWASRYLELPEITGETNLAAGRVRVAEANRAFLREVFTDDHRFYSDEPTRAGGSNLGPDPYELLLASLGTCTSMTVRMYANRKEWPLEDIDVTLSHRRDHVEDCEKCEESGGVADIISREIRLVGDLSEDQLTRLLEIADRCPVHKTLHNEIRVETRRVE